jgi:hypothetical protein
LLNAHYIVIVDKRLSEAIAVASSIKETEDLKHHQAVLQSPLGSLGLFSCLSVLFEVSLSVFQDASSKRWETMKLFWSRDGRGDDIDLSNKNA